MAVSFGRIVSGANINPTSDRDKALYGERWKTFAGDAGILHFFGNNDLTTTEYVSKRRGKTQIAVTRESELGPEQREQGMTGRSNAIELHDLLTPEEINRHFARSNRLKRQLVIRAGYDSLILQRVEHFDPKGPLTAAFT